MLGNQWTITPIRMFETLRRLNVMLVGIMDNLDCHISLKYKWSQITLKYSVYSFFFFLHFDYSFHRSKRKPKYLTLRTFFYTDFSFSRRRLISLQITCRLGNIENLGMHSKLYCWCGWRGSETSLRPWLLPSSSHQLLLPYRWSSPKMEPTSPVLNIDHCTPSSKITSL